MRPLEKSLPLKLLIAREAVMERFRPHLHEAGVTEQQWRVLRALVEVNELEAGELADRICLKMPSLSRILADLAGRGLIDRRNGENDRRRRLVSISPAGRELFDAMSRQSERAYAKLRKDLGPEAYDTLMAELDTAIRKLAS
ncbi:MAG: homoprotocatechuate degradation operon regulator HpaR [Pseudomonadota bacterium]